jgi:shikimate dehydrogenase
MPADVAQNDPPHDVSKAVLKAVPDLRDAIAESKTGTVLVGLIGAGIQRSRSPTMHEREAAALGMRLIYKLLDLDVFELPPDALGDLMAWAQSVGFAGLNITHPCKQAAVRFVDTLSDDAEAIGAINTVGFKDGTRTGHNTDCSGFAESFRRESGGFSKARTVLLGAGGAGSAVGRALLLNDVGALAIHDREPERAERLCAQLRRQFGARRAAVASDVSAALATADGLVNATPVGTDTHPGIPIDPALIRPEMWVVDINYFKAETELLAAAGKLGCRTIAGKGMAVFQAAHAFEIFTGLTPDVRRMERHFESAPATARRTD